MKVIKLQIEDVCNFIGGSQPPKLAFIYEYQKGYIRLIQTRDYKSDAFKTYIPLNLAKKFCNEQDIMIGRYGPPIFQICRGLSGSYNVALLKAEPKNNIYREYLYYFLKQESVFKYIDKLSARTGGQTGVDLTSLNKYPIILPIDLTSQQKLIKILSCLDNKIILNEKINNKLEDSITLLYNYWFVQLDFPDTNENPYKSSGGEMIYNNKLKREIPKSWNLGTFNDIAEIISGSTPFREDASNFTKNGISWITPKDLSLNRGKKFILKGKIDLTPKGQKESSLKTLPKGTVLLSSRAPVGYMAIASNDLTTNQGFKSFLPYKDYSTTFTYYTIKQNLQTIINNASGSTFKEISSSVLKDIKICIAEKEVIRKFNVRTSAILEKQELLEKENKKLVEIRDWLLPMLMNGQVSVK